MPDLPRIVRRVADAMGPAATAERVEAVSRIVLEEVVAGRISVSGYPAASVAGRRIVVVVVGEVPPALRQALSQSLTDAGCTGLRSLPSGQDAGRVVLGAILPENGPSLADLGTRVDSLAAQFGARAGIQDEALFAVLNGRFS